jgi:hypothetical protein
VNGRTDGQDDCNIAPTHTHSMSGGIILLKVALNTINPNNLVETLRPFCEVNKIFLHVLIGIQGLSKAEITFVGQFTFE